MEKKSIFQVLNKSKKNLDDIILICKEMYQFKECKPVISICVENGMQSW